MVYVIHSVGMRQGSQVGQLSEPAPVRDPVPASTVVVPVVGQQSVAHGTVVDDTLMYCGHTRSVGGGAQVRGGQRALFFSVF